MPAAGNSIMQAQRAYKTRCKANNSGPATKSPSLIGLNSYLGQSIAAQCVDMIQKVRKHKKSIVN